MSKNLEGEVKIELINKIIREGKLKTDTQTGNKLEAGDIKCIQEDNKSLPIQSVHIANPLFKTVERVFKDLGNKKIKEEKLTEAFFSSVLNRS